jgi:glycosyltransferase involved in cell wall biosynthesis
MKKKLIKTSTIPTSLDTFCKGQLKMLSEHFEVVAVSSPDKELKLIEEREGVRTIAVPMERHISIVNDLKSLFKMIRVFRQEKPYIVHSMTPKAGLISMLAAKICGVPVRMHTYTGLVFPTETGVKQKILIWMDKLLCACATYINPEGQGVANDLKKFKITKKPLHIIGNGNVRGIDADYWKRSNNERKTKDEGQNSSLKSKVFTFVFVGRIVGDKGINELIEAFKRLKPNSSKLILVGRFEDKFDPVRLETKQEIEVNPNIVCTGQQPDVRPFYEQADAFVFPSYREGFPNTVMEAGAMELPCIVTNINGSNEIIIPDKNGVIVQPRDSYALYEAMKRFIDHPEFVQKLSANARKMIINRYEQHYIWNELLKVYQSLSNDY